jgi:ribosome-associated protein
MALIPTVQARAAQASPDPVRVPAEPDTGQLVRTILNSLDDAKAEDVLSIDLHGKTSLADAMIIATGRSTTHVSAIADRVMKGCKEAGFPSPRVEGLPHCDWVLVDAGDVIVHLFRPEVRQFYNLEKMWGGDRPAEQKAEKRA